MGWRKKHLLKAKASFFVSRLTKKILVTSMTTIPLSVSADNTISGFDKLEEVTDHCRANYSISERILSIPCVDVLGAEVRSQAMQLQLLSFTKPWEFVTTVTDISDSNSTVQNCRATLNHGELSIPCIEVSNSNGGNTQTYEARLEQTAVGKSLRFTVIEINETDNSPARKQRRSTRRESYGTLLGEFNGVTVYSNGRSSYVSNQSHYIDGKYIGMKWQCVEYIRRYYYQKFGLNLGDKHRGDAKTFWANASKMQLDRFSNGGTVAPKIGDIAVSDSGTYGHVGIVRSVSDNQTCVAQQNVHQTAGDVNACTTLSLSDGKYTIGDFDGTTLPITGWLRLKTVDISRNGQNIVDDKDDALWNGGTQSYWNKGYNTGYDSRVLYTYATAKNENNFCKWNVNIVDPGNYEVSVYVPSNYATSEQAKYKIWTGSQVEYRTISQKDYSNKWVKLGEYDFQAGLAAIKLSDNTGEAASLKRMVACDAVKFTYKASQDSDSYQYHGTGSIISYHGRLLPNNAGQDWPHGITRDIVRLHAYSGKPVGFYQWQIEENGCQNLKLDAAGLSSSQNNVDVTIGPWNRRDEDITFSSVSLPFVLGESNTDYDLQSGDWYVIKVALRNRLTQEVTLKASCTTASPTHRNYQPGGGDAVVMDGGYQWNGNASIIAHLFRSRHSQSNQTNLSIDWPYAAFIDVSKVHRSSEKPMVFYQWQRDAVCASLTFDVELPADQKRVDIHVKNWNAPNDTATVHNGVTLPYTISDHSTDGVWRLVQIKFLKPVSYTAKVTAKCPGID